MTVVSLSTLASSRALLRSRQRCLSTAHIADKTKPAKHQAQQCAHPRRRLTSTSKRAHTGSPEATDQHQGNIPPCHPSQRARCTLTSPPSLLPRINESGSHMSPAQLAARINNQSHAKNSSDISHRLLGGGCLIRADLADRLRENRAQTALPALPHYPEHKHMS